MMGRSRGPTVTDWGVWLIMTVVLGTGVLYTRATFAVVALGYRMPSSGHLMTPCALAIVVWSWSAHVAEMSRERVSPMPIFVVALPCVLWLALWA